MVDHPEVRTLGDNVFRPQCSKRRILGERTGLFQFLECLHIFSKYLLVQSIHSGFSHKNAKFGCNIFHHNLVGGNLLSAHVFNFEDIKDQSPCLPISSLLKNTVIFMPSQVLIGLFQVHAVVLNLPLKMCQKQAMERFDHEGGLSGNEAHRVVGQMNGVFRKAGLPQKKEGFASIVVSVSK